MCFWQSLRPHFLCRYCDRKFARRPPKPIASVVSGKFIKKTENVNKKQNEKKTREFWRKREDKYLFIFTNDYADLTPTCVLIAKDENEAIKLINAHEIKTRNVDFERIIPTLDITKFGIDRFIVLRNKIKIKTNEESRIVEYRRG